VVVIKIAVINPVTTREFEPMTADELRDCCPPDVVTEVVSLKSGPPSIQCLLDEAAAIPGIMESVRELDGRVDAIVVNCFADPGVRMAREITRMPVVGPGESSVCMASQLGQRISVVTVLASAVQMIRHNIRAAGMQHNVVSVRSTGMGVAETVSRDVDVVGRLASECLAAVQEDEADVLVLGCTGMAGLGDEVHSRLLAKGHDIPVVSPTPAAIYIAYYQVRMRLEPSIPRCG
jgi:allantoin racemase